MGKSPREAMAAKRGMRSAPAGSGKKPRVMTYGLLEGATHQIGPMREEMDNFELHVVPFGDSVSFLDFDCVVLFSGVFERTRTERGSLQPEVRCEGDLDRREREVHTLYKRGTPLVFLVKPIKRRYLREVLPDESDLFRRVLVGEGIHWEDLVKQKVSNLSSEIPEFKEFIQQHGVASVSFEFFGKTAKINMIAGSIDTPFAFELGQTWFFLPCHEPMKSSQAIEMAGKAAAAVLGYRSRLSKEMPAWTGEFQFSHEAKLHRELDEHHEKVTRLETELDRYKQWKGSLCYQSDPLVEIVTELLRSVFGLELTTEDQKIEDAIIVSETGKTLAVVEIKGVSTNFKRDHVNQVDSHRERLNHEDVPGLLIMNTMMKTGGLDAKDEQPHSDIISKAASDKVLLIRTLDLLRYADLIEQGKKTKDDFLKCILNEVGWLSVSDDNVCVVKE